MVKIDYRAQAAFADRLADIVSYGPDKITLRKQAIELRRIADEADQGRPIADETRTF